MLMRADHSTQPRSYLKYKAFSASLCAVKVLQTWLSRLERIKIKSRGSVLSHHFILDEKWKMTFMWENRSGADLRADMNAKQ